MPGTASAPAGDKTGVEINDEQKHNVAGVLNMLKNIKLPQLPHQAKVKEVEVVGELQLVSVPSLCLSQGQQGPESDHRPLVLIQAHVTCHMS